MEWSVGGLDTFLPLGRLHIHWELHGRVSGYSSRKPRVERFLKKPSDGIHALVYRFQHLVSVLGFINQDTYLVVDLA